MVSTMDQAPPGPPPSGLPPPPPPAQQSQVSAPVTAVPATPTAASPAAPLYPPETPVEPKVLYVESLPGGEAVSQTLVVISVVVLLFGIIGGIAYFSFTRTLEEKLAEREENDLLYQEPGETNILGFKDTLPEIEIGKTANSASAQQQGLGLAQQQAMQKLAAQGNAASAKATVATKPSKADPTAKNTDTPTPSPSPTDVPDNVYVSKDESFSLEHENWTKSETRTEGDTEIETLKSPDGKYSLHIGVTSKKYSTVQEYLDTDPRGRKPQNGTTDITIGGESGKKANTFELTTNGTTVRTIAGYVLSKDKEKVISIELDTTELDVNNNKNEDIFDKIKSSFKFLEKKD
ncbi:MAG: hypothetical protein N2691_04300 [Patescibacteria group bacterium]|nr:hypothetical protein [Patescibacteria group bacterium]